MTNKLFWGAATPLALLTGSIANANESPKGIYAYGSVGGSSMANQVVKNFIEHVKHGKDFSYELGIGYDFGKYRLEASFLDHHHNEFDWAAFNCISCKGSWQSILATAYIDFENISSWTPFVGLSVGSMSSDLSTNDASGFVYGVQTGASYEIKQNIDLIAKISLLRADNLDYGNKVEVSDSHLYSAHVGVRYRF